MVAAAAAMVMDMDGIKLDIHDRQITQQAIGPDTKSFIALVVERILLNISKQNTIAIKKKLS